MKKLENAFKAFQTICVTSVVGLSAIWITANTVRCSKYTPERNYEYEEYCDSIWRADPDYYMDVLEETDEYQEYIDTHGEWWEEDCPAYIEMKEANDFKREVLDAQDNCIQRAEYLLQLHGIHDEEYSRYKSVVDSLYDTQL